MKEKGAFPRNIPPYFFFLKLEHVQNVFNFKIMCHKYILASTDQQFYHFSLQNSAMVHVKLPVKNAIHQTKKMFFQPLGWDRYLSEYEIPYYIR